jgi:hypothetical protein
MSSQKAFGRSQHLGSFLRPQRLAEARARWKAGTLTINELRSTEDEEISKFVDGQRAAGIGCFTDGEFRREVSLFPIASNNRYRILNINLVLLRRNIQQHRWARAIAHSERQIHGE